jgi:hypothetical protein
MPSSSGAGGKGTGSAPKSNATKGGSASNAALHDDEDLMFRRRLLFNGWKQSKRPKQMIDYSNSPSPPIHRTK